MSMRLLLIFLIPSILCSCNSTAAFSGLGEQGKVVVALGKRPLTIVCGNELSDTAKTYERMRARQSDSIGIESVRMLGTVDKGFLRVKSDFENLILLLSVPHNKYPVGQLLILVAGVGGKDNKSYFETNIHINEFEKLVELYKSSDFGSLCEKDRGQVFAVTAI